VFTCWFHVDKYLGVHKDVIGSWLKVRYIVQRFLTVMISLSLLIIYSILYPYT